MKKFASVLMSLVLVFFASVVLSACGDKYKNMKLVVSYAQYMVGDDDNIVLDETGEPKLEWVEVDYEAGWEFTLAENFKNSDDGSYDLIMKVEVKGAKKKVDHIDFYSEGAFALTNVSSVQPGKSFIVKIPGAGSTTLYFRPSVKSDTKQVSFNARFYNELEEIKANENYSAAVVRDSVSDLNTLLAKTGKSTDLILYAGVDGNDTNQDGVLLSIDGIEANGGVYTVGDVEGKRLILDVNDNKNVLTVESGFEFNSVKINVESVYLGKTSTTIGLTEEELKNYQPLHSSFDLKIVDNLSDSSVRLDYESSYDDSFSESEITKTSLYLKKGYNSTNVVLTANFGGLGFVANSDKDSYNGFSFKENETDTTKYEVYALVGDSEERIELDGSQTINGINIIEKTEELDPKFNNKFNKVFTITSVQENSDVKVKFEVGFTNLLFAGSKDFSLNSENVVLSCGTNITTESLPHSVNINGTAYSEENNSFTDKIFTKYKPNAGYELSVNAPISEEESALIKMLVYTKTVEGKKGYETNKRPLNVTSFNGGEVNYSDEYYTLSDYNNDIKLSFDDTNSNPYPSEVYIDFMVLVTPKEFEGKVVEEEKYITITLALNVVGTLDGASLEYGGKDVFNVEDPALLLETGKVNTFNLNLKSTAGEVAVDYSTIIIKTKNFNKILRANKEDWTNEINCGELIDNQLYIKSNNSLKDNLILETTDSNNVLIESINASSMTSCLLNFVDVVDDSNINLKWDSTYVSKLGESATYYIDEDEVSYQGYYLAINRNKTSLFNFVDSYGNHKGIYKVDTKVLTTDDVKQLNRTVKSYQQSSIKATPFSDGYKFNIKTEENSSLVAPISIVKATAYYYEKNGNDIASKTKTYYLEIANYVPVTNMSLEVSEDELYYVNSIITDKSTSKMELTVLPSNATKNIYFSTLSDNTIGSNDENIDENGDNILNRKYNNSSTNGTGYIYDIQVWPQPSSEDGVKYSETGIVGYDGYNYLDLNDAIYEFKLTAKIASECSFPITFILRMFREEDTKKTYSQQIKIVSYNKAKTVTPTGLMNNNAYLSLQTDEGKQLSFTASVDSAATYKGVGYELYDYYGGSQLTTSPNLKVNIDLDDNINKISLTATGSGGKYLLRLGSLDSYDDDTKHFEKWTDNGVEHTPYTDIIVNISDGSRANPFYLHEDTDVENIKKGLDKHYVLAADIDLSKMTTPIDSFSGSINGVIEIYDGGNTFTTQHKFKNLNITNTMNAFIKYNSGELLNLVFDGVTINCEIKSGLTENNDFDLSIIACENNGTITNCSTRVESGSVVIDIEEGGTNASSFNISSYVAKNNGIINFYNGQSGVASYNIETQMSDIRKLNIDVLGLGGNSTTINIGPIAQNSGTIDANYRDTNKKSFKEYITAESYITFNVADMISDKGAYNIGGFVGVNTGTINQVALVGKLTANGDNISLGGLVGKQDNSSAITNSATYALTVVGGANDEKGEDGNVIGKEKTILNQYVGGAVGQLLSGTVKNVNVLILDLSSLGYYNESIVQGMDVIGGLVGYAKKGDIAYSNVQNFLDKDVIVGDFENNLTPTEGTKPSKSIAGLIGLFIDNTVDNTVDLSIEYCFAKANISAVYAESVATLVADESCISNSYFIGSVANMQLDNNETADTEDDENVNDLDNSIINNCLLFNSSDNVYSLVYGWTISDDTNSYVYGILYNKNNIVGYFYTDKDGVEQYSSTAPSIADGSLNLEDAEIVKNIENALIEYAEWTDDSKKGWDNTEWVKYNSGLPVILDEFGNKTLIALPEDIDVDVDDGMFEEDQNPVTIVLQEENKNQARSNVFAEENKNKVTNTEPTFEQNKNGIFVGLNGNTTAIVFVSDKEYNLVKENEEDKQGLLSKTLIPDIAVNGEYFVKVLEGQDLITLKGNKIKFNKAGRVKLEFVTVFNASIRDSVVFYVENPVDKLGLIVDNKIVGDDDSVNGFMGSATVLNLQALFNDKLSNIDTNKLLVEIGEVEVVNNDDSDDDSDDNSDDNSDDDSNDYSEIIVKSLGNATNGLYSFNDIQITVNQLKNNRVEFNIPINIYLNLDKYMIDIETLKEWLNDESIDQEMSLYQYIGQNRLVTNRNVTLIAYQTAQDVRINSTSRVLGAGEVLDVEVEVLSSFINNEDTKTNISFSNKYMYLGIQDKESLTAMIELVDNTWFESELSRQGLSLNSLWEIFDITVVYELKEDRTGYVYNYTFELKDEYKRIISLNDIVKFKFTFLATTNTEKYDTITYIVEPQSFTSVRVENFAGGVSSKEGNDTICEFNNGERPSSMIEPGKSGLLKIYVDSSYARWDKLLVSSSSIYLDKTYEVKFQQMYYDENKGYYYALPSMVDENGSLIITKAISSIDKSGNEVYDGVIYVRTVIDSNIIGSKDEFNITVQAIEYERDDNNLPTNAIKTEFTKILPIMVWYKVGLSLNVLNAETGTIENDGTSSTKVYLIEKNSNNVYIDVVAYGYENQAINVNYSGAGIDSVYLQKVSEEPIDNAYKIRYQITTYDLKASVTLEFKLTGVGLSSSNTATQEITFYPVDYIPSSVSVKNTASDVMLIPVNSSEELSIIWNSNNQKLNSDEINQYINNPDNNESINDNGILKYFNVINISNGNISEENLTKYLSNSLQSTTHSSFKITEEKGKFSLWALEEDVLTVKFEIYYTYVYDAVNEKFNIVFNDAKQGTGLSYTFRLNLVVNTSEEEPLPIYSEEEFINAMSVGENYILMKDIDLSEINWTPITPAIKSLDGNGKLIKLGNIQATRSENEGIIAGLFAQIPEGTIIKNLAIDVSNITNEVSLADQNAENLDTYFGFLAGRNQGLVYNCEIIALKKTNIIINTSTSNAYIGVLVGENTGNITNSRVGTSHFEIITFEGKNGATRTESKTCAELTVESNGIVAGFVAVNSGIISSSYFHYANIINNSAVANDNLNMTAGFVAINSGKIYNSYVSGKGMTAKSDRATDNMIYASGNGNATGFVYLNSGEVENCYSNIFVKSHASGVSGFVFNNASNGVISQCYSASKVKSEGLSTELPFVGAYIDDAIDATRLMSYGILNNCYYLELEDEKYNSNFISTDSNGNQMDLPVALNSAGFNLTDNLSNFAFVEGDMDQASQGVWTYYTTLDQYNTDLNNLGKSNLPQLTSANQIARSVRYMEAVGDEQVFKYATNYSIGSKNNPYIIRDYNEYNSIFNLSSTASLNKFNGHIRFIDDISFLEIGENQEEKYVTINTTLNFTLGDEKGNNVTVIDGNGMTISDVKLTNNDEKDIKSMGLFNEMYYSVVKNLDVEFAEFEYSSTSTIYSGGLAGIAKDSYIINIDLISNRTQITAQNFAGGVAGIVYGNSGLYNINSNLNVETAHKAKVYNQYFSYEDFKKYYASLGYANAGGTNIDEKYSNYLKTMSYAGGIAGVIDIGSSNTIVNDINVNKLTVGETGSVLVVGDMAGYVAGYIGRGVFANRINSVMSDSSQVLGRYVSAGMVAENYGRIRYSQVSYDKTTQEEIDQHYADYIMSVQSKKYVALDTILNKQFVAVDSESLNISNVAGGLVGVNYGGQIEDSYTKATITADANYIGGLVGVNIGGTYHTVYNESYIDLTQERTEFVGGLVGINSTGDDFRGLELYKLKGYSAYESMKVDQFVSAMIVDVTQLDMVYKKPAEKTPKINYVVAESDRTIRSIQNTGSPSDAFYLTYSNLEITPDGVDISALISSPDRTDISILASNAKHIEDLYNLNSENQVETFENMFGNWSDLIWEKKNDKYFPILNENPITSTYEIRNANDLILIELHPDADFAVYGRIVLDETYENYVLDVNFTGTMTGYSYGNEDPAFVGIKIRTDDTTNSAGFFRATNGASITNLAFEYKYLAVKDEKNSVGLVSADDINSQFTRLNVRVNNDDLEVDYLGGGDNGDEYSVVDNSYIFTHDTGTINYFGGIVGTTSTAIIQNCNVKLNINITTDGDGGVGGIAGIANTGPATINYVGCLISNCSYSGNMNINSTAPTNIGGIVGQTNRVDISGSEVFDSTITLTGSVGLNVGGVAGKLQDSWVNDVDVDLSISSGITMVGLVEIGGLAGKASNADYKVSNGSDVYVTDPEIINSRAKLHLINSSNQVTYNVGGLVGSTTNSLRIIDSIAWVDGKLIANKINFGGLVAVADENELLKIDNCFAYLEKDNSAQTNVEEKDYSGLSLIAPSIVAGGFVGEISGSSMLVDITNSSVAGAIWADDDNESSTITGTDLTLGGMIGKIKANSDNVELLTINDDLLKDVENNTYLNQIKNSFTTLVLETSAFRFTEGSISDTATFKNNYNVSAILGKTETTDGKSNTLKFIDNDSNPVYIKLENVYYSSDMNLAVEEKGKENPTTEDEIYYVFNGIAIDLQANSIFFKDNRNQFFKDGWALEHNSGLPYRTSLYDSFITLKLAAETSSEAPFVNMQGSSLNPDNGIFDGTNYKYHIYNNTNGVELSGNLNGFVTFSGTKLAYNVAATPLKNNGANLRAHSVISNLSIDLVEMNETGIADNGSDLITLLNNGGIVSQNLGTIFNVTIDYYYKDIAEPDNYVVFGAGIAGINNGNILYCNNVGTIEGVKVTDGFAGLTKINNGFITHSAFIGTIDTHKDSYNKATGIAWQNSAYGLIYNTYSAGVVSVNNNNSSFVLTNNGKLINCYYDKFANTENNEFDGLTATDTNTLQTNKAGLIGTGWYDTSLQSRIVSETDEAGNTSTKLTEMLNYGYPIYHISQTYYDNSNKEIKNSKIKGLSSGDGTENSPYLLTNIGTMMEINKLYTNANIDSLNKQIYFKLINDVDFSKSGDPTKDATKFEGWTGIGTSSKPFTGVFITGERFKRNVANYTCMRYINNSPSGLFANLKGLSETSVAQIYNVAFGSSLGGSGVLADNVGGDTTITNILFGELTHKVTQVKSTGSFAMSGTNAGLIGAISGNNVTIKNINVLEYNEFIKSDLYSINDALKYQIMNNGSHLGGLIGLIGSTEESSKANISNINISNINIGSEVVVGHKDDTNLTVGGLIGLNEGNVSLEKVNLTPKSVYAEMYIGGVIGEMAGGEITISKNADNVLGSTGSVTGGSATTSSGLNIVGGSNDSAMGGFVGKMTSGKLLTEMPSGFKLGADENSYAGLTGGLVGLMTGGEINGQAGEGEKVELTINTMRAKSYAGGIVGSIQGGTVNNFKLEIQAQEDDSILSNDGFGAVAGAGSGGKITNVEVSGEMNISKVKKLGGLVGHLRKLEGSSSTLNLSDVKVENLNITRKKGGSISESEDGVGGLIGVMATGISFGKNIEVSAVNITCGTGVANVGGLVGLMEHNELLGSEGDEGDIEITNITITGVENVGGMFGQYVGENTLVLGKAFAELMANSQISISLPTDESGLGDIVNVGGVFGYYNSIAPMFYDLDESTSGAMTSEDPGTVTSTTGEEPAPETPVITPGENAFTTANNVFYFDNIEKLEELKVGDDFAYLNKGHKDNIYEDEELAKYSISNVGGIAGKTTSSTISGSYSGHIGLLGPQWDKMLYTDIEKASTLNLINVGGIAGVYEKAEETTKFEFANITVSSSDNKNAFGVNMVAGIVGYENVGGVLGTIQGGSDKVIDFELSNVKISEQAVVSGYFNIGLIFGYATNLFNIVEPIEETTEDGGEGVSPIADTEGEPVDTKSTISGTAIGYKNVGGIVGAVSETSRGEFNSGNTVDNNYGIKVSTISGFTFKGATVAGVMNVGGVLGNVASGFTIANVKTDESEPALTVQGNANVGGAVGYNTANGDSNVVILKDLELKNIQILAKRLKHAIDDTNTKEVNEALDSKNNDREIVYMATSIGGAVGYAGNVNINNGTYAGIIKEALTETKNSDESISYTEKYIDSEGNGHDMTASASVISNYVIKGASEYKKTYKTLENMDYGIGGIIGTFVDYTVPKYSTDDDGKPADGFTTIRVGLTGLVNSQMNIDMPNGINVGGSIGYWYYQEEGSTPLKASTLNIIPGMEINPEDSTAITTINIGNSDKSYIAGAMSVGGLVGKIRTANNTDVNYFDDVEEFDGGSGTGGIQLGNIELQTRINESGEEESVFGQYVGGVVGHVVGNINRIQLKHTSHLVINNEIGDGFGGIVGKLQGNLGKGKKTGTYSHISVNYQGAGNDEATKTGIFKHKDNYNYGGLVGILDVKDDAEVVGRHWYAFTVHTVNTTESALTTDSNTLYYDDTLNRLMLTSHIVNNQNIQIAYPMADAIPDNNPLLNGADTGWHKEYSMFQRVQVSKTNTDRASSADTLSTNVIYDAINVKYVEVGYLDLYNQGITATLYSYGEDNEILYTPYGLATKISDYELAEGEIKDDGTVEILKNRFGFHDIKNPVDYIDILKVKFEMCYNSYFSEFRKLKIAQQFYNELLSGTTLDYDLNSLIDAIYDNSIPLYGKLLDGKTYIYTAIYAEFGSKDVSPDVFGDFKENDITLHTLQTGSLFDINASIKNRQVQITKTKTNWWDRFMIWFFDLFNFWDDPFTPNLTKAEMLEANKGWLLEYITDTYEGYYGLIGGTSSQEWYFTNGEIYDLDDIKKIESKFYTSIENKNNDIASTKELLYYYCGLTRPLDYDSFANYFEITKEKLGNEAIAGTDLIPNIGEWIPKYVFEGGAWYISIYAGETKKTTISNTVIEKLRALYDSGKGNNCDWAGGHINRRDYSWTFDNAPDGTIYIHYDEDGGIFPKSTLEKRMDISIDTSRLLEETEWGKITYKYFGVDKPVANSLKEGVEFVENFDYIKLIGTYLDWKFVSTGNESDLPSAMCVPVYEEIQIGGSPILVAHAKNKDDNNIDNRFVGYFTALNEDNFIISSSSKSFNVNLKIGDLLSGTIYDSDSVNTWIHENSMGTPFIDDVFLENQECYGIASSLDWVGSPTGGELNEKIFMYKLYSPLPDGFIIDGDNVFEILKNPESVRVFKGQVATLLTEIGESEIGNYTFVATTGDAYSADKLYKKIDGVWYTLSTDYVYEGPNNDGTGEPKVIKKIKVVPPEGVNLKDGKCVWNVGGFKIYTRYEHSGNWSCSGYDLNGNLIEEDNAKDFLNALGFLPGSTDYTGTISAYHDTYLCETAMISFNTYDSDGKKTAGFKGIPWDGNNFKFD